MPRQTRYDLEQLLQYVEEMGAPATLPAMMERYNQTFCNEPGEHSEPGERPRLPKLTISNLEGLRKTGLSHKQADLLATAYDVAPWAVWPAWAADTSADALYEPTPDTIQRYAGKKYRPGGLRRAIIEIANTHLGEPISPASVARELGRERTTQVYSQMRQLAAQGHLEVYGNNPARYILRYPLDLGPSTELELAENEQEQNEDEPGTDSSSDPGPAVQLRSAWVVLTDYTSRLGLRRGTAGRAALCLTVPLPPGRDPLLAAQLYLLSRYELLATLLNPTLRTRGSQFTTSDEQGRPQLAQLLSCQVPTDLSLPEPIRFCTRAELGRMLSCSHNLFEPSVPVALEVLDQTS